MGEIMNQPIISICIPTKNRVDILRETLKSILNENINPAIFEICVSDNSLTDETKNLINEEFSEVTNLRYNKSDCQGFLNSIEALKLGKGKLLKLHNDYSKFTRNGLILMIKRIETYTMTQPTIFFAMHSLENMHDVVEFDSFDNFLNNISYMSTWSSAFSIWKTDLDKLIAENVQVDHMFPHTTLLFSLTEKEQYVVDNSAYVENLPLKRKGGYNLIDNFVHIYLTMVSSLLKKQIIRQETYNKIEKDIIKFSAHWYAVVKSNKNFTFTFENKNELIKNQCGKGAVKKFYCYFCYYYAKILAKKCLGRE